MSDDLQERKNEIIWTATHLYTLLHQLQNSGLVDEYECSVLTANAEDLREEIIIFFEELVSEA